jgi:phosphoribosylanthranilate isomerase
MWTKICANTNLHDAQLAAELGADAVGFVFAPSKRQVTIAQVAAITPHLPDAVQKIGVFATGPDNNLNPGAAPQALANTIASAVREAGLTGAQLHGSPDPALIEHLTAELEGRTRLLQVVGYEAGPADPAAEQRFLAELRLALPQPGLWAVLLDARQSGVSGGLGVAFDWTRAAILVEQASREAHTLCPALPRLIVAGGLRAENVGDAIAALHPDGVDVASGVEASPGSKDPVRLRAFLSAVRSADSPPAS